MGGTISFFNRWLPLTKHIYHCLTSDVGASSQCQYYNIVTRNLFFFFVKKKDRIHSTNGWLATARNEITRISWRQMKRMSENCLEIWNTSLLITLTRQRSLSYRSQCCKSIDWFLYDRNLCHEKVTLKSFFDCLGEEFQNSLWEKKTVDKDILITSWNSDRKIMQSIRITSVLLITMRK